MQIIELETSKHSEILDITERVDSIVQKSGIKEGICIVFCPHTTAAITINENADPSVKKDMINSLETLIPWTNDYAHIEGNSAAHIKSAMIGSSRTIIVKDGHLMLGTWQGIFFIEFDGPRKREVYMEVVPK